MSSTWRYELRQVDDSWYKVVEVYYDENGDQTGETEGPVSIEGESAAEILMMLELVKAACQAPDGGGDV